MLEVCLCSALLCGDFTAKLWEDYKQRFEEPVQVYNVITPEIFSSSSWLGDVKRGTHVLLSLRVTFC